MGFLDWFRERAPANPPTLGYLNLGGQAHEAHMLADLESLSTLFPEPIVSERETPTCTVLFVCFTISSTEAAGAASRLLCNIIADSGAKVVVVASEIPEELIEAVFKDIKLGSTNIVLTLERKGDRFGAFFEKLLRSMLGGKAMPVAWNTLAPQIPGAAHEGPVSLYVPAPGRTRIA
jgi:hypothetical protein